MKYKLIPAMSHNFTHSFMSMENYVDGGYVYEEMQQLARDNPRRIFTIHWVPEIPEEVAHFSDRIRKSIDFWRKALPKHLENHRIEPQAIRELRTDVFLAPNHQIHVRAVAIDDRGKEHSQLVWSA